MTDRLDERREQMFVGAKQMAVKKEENRKKQKVVNARMLFRGKMKRYQTMILKKKNKEEEQKNKEKEQKKRKHRKRKHHSVHFTKRKYSKRRGKSIILKSHTKLAKIIE